MDPNDNPFKPPVDTTFYEAQVINPAMLWRKDNLLVMHKGAELPNRCVKSNVPTKRRLKRKLTWHTPWIYLTILISILVYIIIALIISKKATIHIGLSDAWFAKRYRAIAIGWTCAIASIVVPIVAIAMLPPQDDTVLFIVFGAFFLFLFGAIFGLVRSRMVVTTRITDDYVWLRGVCPEFLKDLPQWPYQP